MAAPGPFRKRLKRGRKTVLTQFCAYAPCGALLTGRQHFRFCSLEHATATRNAIRAAIVLANLERVYAIIASAAEAGGFTPASADIGKALGFTATTAMDYVSRLVTAGRIARVRIATACGQGLAYIDIAAGNATKPKGDGRRGRGRPIGPKRLAKLDAEEDALAPASPEEVIAALYAGRRYEDDPRACRAEGRWMHHPPPAHVHAESPIARGTR